MLNFWLVFLVGLQSGRKEIAGGVQARGQSFARRVGQGQRWKVPRIRCGRVRPSGRVGPSHFHASQSTAFRSAYDRAFGSGQRA